MSSGRLAGKVALITGAASGIGLATAERFAVEGAAVVLADNQADALAGEVGRLQAAGHQVVGSVMDVTRSEDVARGVARAVSAFGRLDILFANAGIGYSGDLIHTSDDDWDRVMAVNARGVFVSCREAVRQMLAQASPGGAVIINGSISGLVGIPQQAPYAPSKGAVVELTRQLAVEYATRHIRVNCVCPGSIDTPVLQTGMAMSGDPAGFLAMLVGGSPDRAGRPARGGCGGRPLPRLRRGQLHHGRHPGGRRRLHGSITHQRTFEGRPTMWGSLLRSILLAALPADAGVTRIQVDAGQVLHRVSPLLTGACIEDVNHEIYGGLYSQMIFGESFQEPPPAVPIKGFATLGGRWTVAGDELRAAGGDGPKLVLGGPPLGAGQVAVDLRFPTDQPGNAGLIVKVERPEVGADAWTGYEVSLETAGRLVLGRHRRNWEPIRTVPCAVPVDRWINLAVRLGDKTIEVRVDGQLLLTYEDQDHPLGPGQVGLRNWQRPITYRNLQIQSRGEVRKFPFVPVVGEALASGVSGMWRPLVRGAARGQLAIEADRPFVGRQSQRLTFEGGTGEVGVENRGLNRWGLNLVEGKPTEGYVYLRADQPAPVTLALETGDGARILAATTVAVASPAWTRYDFALTPQAADRAGRFAIKLTQPGAVVVGHAFLQPGEWGRFRGLPVRKDVAEGLIDQGVSVLRYGGSMVNRAGYRWKQMIGPRALRPPYDGTWYPYSSNGWGIIDFLDFTEALGIPGIPAFFMGESPADMADFVEYVNGPATSPWGQKRVERRPPRPLPAQADRAGERGEGRRGLLGQISADGRGDLGEGPGDHPRRRRLRLQAGDHQPRPDRGE